MGRWGNGRRLREDERKRDERNWDTNENGERDLGKEGAGASDKESEEIMGGRDQAMG